LTVILNTAINESRMSAESLWNDKPFFDFGEWIETLRYQVHLQYGKAMIYNKLSEFPVAQLAECHPGGESRWFEPTLENISDFAYKYDL